MSLIHTFEPSDQLILVSGSGAIRLEDRLSLVERLLRSDVLGRAQGILLDFSKVENVPTYSEVPQVAWIWDRLWPVFRGRLAIVVGYPGHATMASMTILASENSANVRWFESVASARDWALDKSSAMGSTALSISS